MTKEELQGLKELHKRYAGQNLRDVFISNQNFKRLLEQTEQKMHLEEENKRLREALEFYADEGTYKLTGEKVYTGHGSYDEACWREIENDNGQKARQTLEGK